MKISVSLATGKYLRQRIEKKRGLAFGKHWNAQKGRSREVKMTIVKRLERKGKAATLYRTSRASAPLQSVGILVAVPKKHYVSQPPDPSDGFREAFLQGTFGDAG